MGGGVRTGLDIKVRMIFFYFSLKAILLTVSGTRDNINTPYWKTMLSFTSTDPDIMPIFLI